MTKIGLFVYLAAYYRSECVKCYIEYILFIICLFIIGYVLNILFECDYLF